MSKFDSYFRLYTSSAQPTAELEFSNYDFIVYDKFDGAWKLVKVIQHNERRMYYLSNGSSVRACLNESEILLEHERIPQTNLGKLLYV